MEKKPKNKVIVSERARQILAGHILFLAQVSPTAARRKKNELMDAIRSLSTMPERLSLGDEPTPAKIGWKC